MPNWIKDDRIATLETENFEKVAVSSVDELNSGLSISHSKSEDVWLVIFKKEIKEKYVS